MQIEFKTKKLEKVCTNAQEAEKRHGRDMALKIHQRIDEIKAALNVEMMVQFGIGRCHQLKGNRRDQYAVDLVHPYRLVFEKKGKEIQIANIMEIVDYHN
ncbi:type II toxin-antitoxin system RelE/ParE family toxin [Sedimentibacter hydroxybenzoicus DSM 7310]|uniref:Type II toxin-antitoxin system RelE/ParE family toxin n=1 Tax=Sedimentibacter hydroxybenzoicus DSM 7310 TaxID=1123245 RepID=A0A974GVK1_SEDHY|nr:type II toxin-antitoxin system RelE/ParE family toxin [Sedimentibacter hydroxybenzoicus]NYB73448.1 type II toxin-antitoxin system RelE/ParE family toxin [Sedimentibacter hydroxybenzoicus DSM 7310]